MDYKTLLGLLTLGIGIVAYGTYFRQILLKQVTPHPFSWLIWGFVESIAFFAMFVKHAGAGAWATGLTGLCCFTIAGLAFFYSKKLEIFKIDWLFLTLAVISLILWILTKDPTMSVILLTLTDALGMAFTLRKSYFDPFQESASLFGLSGIRSGIAVFALQSYNLSTWLYPTALVFTNALVVTMILSRRISLKHQSNV